MTEKKRANNQTLRIVQEKIRDQMNMHSNHILDNGCEDFPDYKFQVGIIRGLAEAELELLDFDDKIDAGED